MREEPLFNIFAYAMKDVPAIKHSNLDKNSFFSYTDIIVNDVYDELKNSIGDRQDSEYAADTVMALNV